MAVEHGGRGDFFAAEGLGDGFEGEVLGFFGGEEDAAVGGEVGGGGLLGGGIGVRFWGVVLLSLCFFDPRFGRAFEHLRRVLRSADRWRFPVLPFLLVLRRKFSFAVAGSRMLW